jgi:hypothetical protein
MQGIRSGLSLDSKDSNVSARDQTNSSGGGSGLKPIDVFVGQRLRHFRETHRMAVSEVSALSGIPDHVIAKYENGEERVPAPDLINLARLFAVGVAQLFPEDLAQITGQLN